MKFLGLRLCEHDSNITYVDTDLSIIKYYKSERDLQIKHHGYNDLTSWTHLIKRWNINLNELSAVGIVFDSFRYPHICTKKNEDIIYPVDIEIFKILGIECPIFKIDHHYAHMMSCWPLSDHFDVNLVFDAFGDNNISHSVFAKKIIKKYSKFEMESLGTLMANFGYYMGLNGSEYDYAGKLMALKSYLKMSDSDINFFMDKMKNFDIFNLKKIWDEKHFVELDNIEKINFLGLAHKKTESIFSDYFSKICKETDIISYSGGVALNICINTILKKKFKNLHVPPHANDEGLSLGIVECLRRFFNLNNLTKKNFPYWQDDEKPSKCTEETIYKTSKFLSEGKIVGWYQGNGEIGPRSLGNRSILMDPTIKNGKNIINQKVKKREEYRPFGCSVILNDVEKYFEWNQESPYMLYSPKIKDHTTLSSISHIDGTSRIQTVNELQNKNFFHLINEFKNMTGIPILLNTSLNKNGKPIAGNFNNALELFTESEIDILVIGNNIYEK
jgi:carbamoyltransferase